MMISPVKKRICVTKFTPQKRWASHLGAHVAWGRGILDDGVNEFTPCCSSYTPTHSVSGFFSRWQFMSWVGQVASLCPGRL